MNNFKTAMMFLLAIGSVGIIVAGFAGLIMAEENRTKTVCEQFGNTYQFKYGKKSPDLCVDNKSGEVRYP